MDTRAARLVNDISTVCGKADEFRSELNRIKDRYTANGGQSFIHLHFIDENGEARTDLPITEDKIITAVARLSDIITALNQYKDVFIQAAP